VKWEEQSNPRAQREFGTEADVEQIPGRKKRTLQKDRGYRRGFPFYRFHGQVLYDLEEVRGQIRAGRVEVTGGGRPT